MSSLHSWVSAGLLSALPCSASCGGITTSIDGGSDVEIKDGASTDAVADSPVDSTSDAHDPCSPGTCRFPEDTSGSCLAPGGPIGMLDSGKLVGCCECGSNGVCSSECVCASPDTPIATPTGDRPIASLSVGDLVLSIDGGHVAAVPVRETRRTAVSNHRVIEVVLRDDVTLRISAAHPTADGRTFGQLRAGDWLGGREIASTRVVPYAHDATYDILPDSDTGTYFAGGALIGSTLVSPKVPAPPFVPACTLPSSSSTSPRVARTVPGTPVPTRGTAGEVRWHSPANPRVFRGSERHPTNEERCPRNAEGHPRSADGCPRSSDGCPTSSDGCPRSADGCPTSDESISCREE